MLAGLSVFADLLSSNVKGMSREPAWSQSQDRGWRSPGLPVKMYLSAGGRSRGRPPSTCVCARTRECVCLQENVPGFLRCSSVLIFAARARVWVFVRAPNPYVFLLLQYGKDASERFNRGTACGIWGYFPPAPLFSTTQTQPDPFPSSGVR